jgi:hypothetical protein
MKDAIQLDRFARSTKHQESEPCRNCDTEYIGNYCPNCGQEAHTGAPTAVAFIYEFLTRNVFERGKLHRTLWHLLRYPGGLTIDFLEGRRQRFIRPVRLYIGLSVVYFLLLSFQSGSLLGHLNIAPNDKAAAKIDEKLKAKAGKVLIPAPPDEPAVLDEADEDTTITLPGKVDISKSKSGVIVSGLSDQGFGGALKKRLQRIMAMPEQERYQVIALATLKQAPQAMFFLVPVFAFLLKILFLFRGIPYGAHLLFAFHYHSVVFLGLISFFIPGADAGVVTAVSIGLVWVYLPLALRNTYGCSWIGSLFRTVTLVMAYALAIFLAFIATLTVAFLLL